MRRKPNERLTSEQKARGWSLEDLATKSGVTSKRINRIECGMGVATPEEQEKLCAVFGMDKIALGLVKEKKLQKRRTEFLREKQENASPTDKLLQASSGSGTMMNVRKRKGGRARKVRRG